MAKHAQKLASRYARSLMSALSRESADWIHQAQDLSGALKAFVHDWWGEALLRDSLQNPMFEKNERLAAVKMVCERAGLPEIAVRFIQVVFERDRIAALPQIVESFAQLADERAGIVKVKVVTAQNVSGEERRSIEDSLRRKIEGNLHFAWEEDAEILGGMLVTYGAKVLDGSLRGRLERIERRLQS